MTAGVLSLFTTYLIYPILGVIIILVAILIAKKNRLLKNKRLIIYTLFSLLFLISPALLGFLDYSFMPYGYIGLAIIYMVGGFYNDRLLPWVFNNDELKYRFKIIYTLFQMMVSMPLFVLVFNLCNEFTYGLWASTVILPFLLLSLLNQSYQLFIYIPTPIYNVWHYEQSAGFSGRDEIDHKQLKVVKVEIFKREEDMEPTRINTKFPEEMILGDWIKLLFDDYNKQWAHAPIELGANSSGWIFYVKSWAMAPRRYLNHELTLKENRIKESHLIVGKRVENSITE